MKKHDIFSLAYYALEIMYNQEGNLCPEKLSCVKAGT